MGMIRGVVCMDRNGHLERLLISQWPQWDSVYSVLFRFPGLTDVVLESRYCIIPGLVTDIAPGEVAS